MTPTEQAKAALERVIANAKSYAGSFLDFEAYKQNEQDCLDLRSALSHEAPDLKTRVMAQLERGDYEEIDLTVDDKPAQQGADDALEDTGFASIISMTSILKHVFDHKYQPDPAEKMALDVVCRAARLSAPVTGQGDVLADIAFIRANLSRQWINKMERELVEDVHARLWKIEAAFRAHQHSQSVDGPTGWKLVPIKPTKNQLDACLGKDETEKNRFFIGGCYTCMINAAPIPPQASAHVVLEGDDLIERARGRSAYLKNKGEIKTTDLIDAMIDRIMIMNKIAFEKASVDDLKRQILTEIIKSEDDYQKQLEGLPPQASVDVAKMAAAYEAERANYMGCRVYYPNNQAAFEGAMKKALAAQHPNLFGKGD